MVGSSGHRAAKWRGVAAGIALAGAIAVPNSPSAQEPLAAPQAQPPPATAPAPAAPPAAAGCARKDFETVVDQAASALRELNIQNRPRFQEKLRRLKDRRAWTEDQFLKEAAPFVKDAEIDTFDRKTNELLGRIASLGDEGSAASTPDCGMYQVLRGHMTALVETQNAKWSYMFRKIDAELAR